MVYYIYILTNKSNTLYTGITNNLERRMAEHRLKLIPGFTSNYNINEAIAIEKKIKGWTRKKKIALIKSINPEFKNLLEKI